MTPEALNDYVGQTTLQVGVKASAASICGGRASNASNAAASVEAAKMSADWAAQCAALSHGVHMLIRRWYGGAKQYRQLIDAMKDTKQALANAQDAMEHALQKVQDELKTEEAQVIER